MPAGCVKTIILKIEFMFIIIIHILEPILELGKKYANKNLLFDWSLGIEQTQLWLDDLK